MFKKNTAVTGFQIGHFIGVADGAAVTTGTPVCKRLLDGSPGTLTNAASYDSTAGVWKIDLAAADVNGDMVGLSFTLTACLPISYTFRTTTKLVSELNDAAAAPSAATNASAVRTELATELGRIDAAVSTRSTYAGADTAGTTELLTRIPDATAGSAGGLPTVDANNYIAGIAGTKNQLDDLTDAPAGPSASDIKTALEADGGKLDHLWEMTEDDGGVRRLTENALELAPAGGGGTADWTADEREQIRYRLQIDGTQTAPDDTDLPAVNVTYSAGVALAGPLATEDHIDGALLAIQGGDSDTLETLSDQIDGLSGVTTFTVSSPVAENGDVELYAGDDYHDSDDRALEWSSSDWPDLTGATIALYLRAPDGSKFSKAGSAPVVGSGSQTVRVELTAAETATLIDWPAPSTLRLRATLAVSGRKVTLVTGVLTVAEDIS